MSDLFAIGASGLRAYQTALTTTSENIANASTPGYSRRSTTINEIGRTNSIQLGQTVKFNGSGARVTGIARSGDEFRAAEVRTTGADLARTEGGIVWLDRIEGALTGQRLGDRLTAFFNAGKAVAADPAAGAPRAVMLESAANLANAFSGSGRALDAAAANLSESSQDAARQLTNLAGSLAQINRGLARADPKSSTQAQLLDERDRILETMSGLVDVDADFDGFGRATVRAGGGAGPILVDGDTAANVSFAMNSSGAVSFALHRGSTTEAIPTHSGAFAGFADGATKIASARETLDEIATEFVDGMNALQTAGRDLDGQPGVAMFTVGDTPTAISLTLDSPHGLAAAAVGEGPRGNGNFANLATLRSSANFEGSLDDLTTSNAAALGARRDVAEAQGSIRDAAVASLQSVSGVDMDEEAINLIRFQQAYQASSRVIQVARELLQTILDIR